MWIRGEVAVTSPSMPARRREATLLRAIYASHPRFAGTATVYEPQSEWLEGGDVLLLGPGVLAVGSGQRTTPAGVETLARRVFTEGLAHTVLVVPIAQERATMHLDTICTMVDVDAVTLYPPVADTLCYPVTGSATTARCVVGPAGAVPRRRRPGARAGPDPGHRHRARPGDRRAGAVGRRQQHAVRGARGWPWRTSGTPRPTPSWRRTASR